MDASTQLQNQGYVVFKNILSAEEVQSLRIAFRKYFVDGGISSSYGLAQPDACGHLEEVQNIVSCRKLIEALRQALPDKKILFTQHCDAHLNLFSGWHRDDGCQVKEFAPNGYFQSEPYGNKNCQVYKCAFYFQAHADNTGLTVVPGSHKQQPQKWSIWKPWKKGPVHTDIAVEAGDMILFDVRLAHCGEPVPWLFQVFSKVPLLRRLVRGLNTFRFALRQARNRDRMSLFFTMGVDNCMTRIFAKNNMARQRRQFSHPRKIPLGSLMKKLRNEDIGVTGSIGRRLTFSAAAGQHVDSPPLRK